MTVTDRDMGYTNLLKIMKSANISADIGIFKGETTNKGESVADYAIKNEYGLGVPERPFTSRAFDKNEMGAYKIIQDDIKQNLIKGNYNLKKSVGRGAEFMVGKIVETIKDAVSWATKNADSTIATKKGINRPLIHHGIMWKAVHWRYTQQNK